MSRFKLAPSAGALLILTAVPEARAITIEASISQEAFVRLFAEGLLSGQNFDTIPAGTILGTVNGVTYSVPGGDPVVTSDFSTTTPPNSLGTSFGFFDSTQSAMISFATSITAFGIDIHTFASNPREYVLMLGMGPAVNSRPVAVAGADNVQFIGFTSDTPFNNIRVGPATESGAGDPFSFSLDGLIYGDAANLVPESTVPEVSNWVLLGSGLGLLARRAQRRLRLNNKHGPDTGRIVL